MQVQDGRGALLPGSRQGAPAEGRQQVVRVHDVGVRQAHGTGDVLRRKPTAQHPAGGGRTAELG